MNNYNPINFHINRETEVLETFDGERYVPLGSANVITNHIKQYDNSNQDVMYLGYRDLYEHPDYINEVKGRVEKFTPRGYHYISAFQKYIGWYYYHNSYLKTSGYHTYRKFHTPLVSRIVGTDKTIETITKTDYNTSIGANGSDVMYSYELTFTDSSMDFVKPVTSSTPYEVVNTKPLSATNAPYSVQHYPVIATELFNKSFENNGNGPRTEIITVRIDWKVVPKDCYFRISHCTNSGNLTSGSRIKIRTLKVNTNKLTPQGDNVFVGYSSDIEEYVQTSASSGRLPVTNYAITKPDGEIDNILQKIERPTERYTYIVAEYSTENNNPNNDSLIGLMFNMFVPEQSVQNYVRGINENRYTFIKDFDKVGKLWNTSAVSFFDYKYFPTFPKQGDIITVISGLDIVGTENIQPTYQEYIYLGPYRRDDQNRVNNPQRGQYQIYYGSRFPHSLPKNNSLNEVLDGNRINVNFWKDLRYNHQTKLETELNKFVSILTQHISKESLNPNSEVFEILTELNR